MEEEQKILEKIIKAIVKRPDLITIKRTVDEIGVLLVLQVAKEDMGIVIGKQGAHANAIKLVLKLTGLPKRKIFLKIEEPIDIEGDKRITETLDNGVKLHYANKSQN